MAEPASTISVLGSYVDVRCALAGPVMELFHLARAVFGYVACQFSGPTHEKEA